MAAKSFLDSLNPTQRIVAGVLIVVIGSVVAFLRVRQEKPPPAPPGEQQTLANRNIRFGMPADAKPEPANKDAYLVERPQYVLSYNDAKKIPNWVCWNLSHADIGKTARSAFTEDPDLPPGFKRVTTGMYTGSGFDRGHVCPSKDRSDTEDNNKPLFYMTNIMPQAPKCNQGAWERFEQHCRDLTKDGSELYIAAGPHGQGGSGTEGEAQAVGKSVKIAVPQSVWKVVLVLPNRDARPDRDSKMLAVWVPNDQTVTEAWKPYQVSVATVEQRTGYTFFPLAGDLGAPKGREP